MATRPDTHKALVDALVDGEVAASELAKRATELGKDIGAQLATTVKALVQARRAGRLTPQEAELRFQELWLALSLAHFAQVAGDVQSTGEEFEQVRAIADKMGPEKLAVSPIRNEDVLARAQEKLIKEPTNGGE